MKLELKTASLAVLVIAGVFCMPTQSTAQEMAKKMDGDNMKITNYDYANQFVKRQYNGGYTL